MTSQNVARRRLLNQSILGGTFSTPENVVRWTGCIQAQDFAQAKWAIGRRGQEAAIAELTIRYFRSRGPATLQDFSWWSGFSLSQAKRGLEMNKDKLAHEVVNGQA